MCMGNFLNLISELLFVGITLQLFHFIHNFITGSFPSAPFPGRRNRAATIRSRHDCRQKALDDGPVAEGPEDNHEPQDNDHSPRFK